MGLGLAGAMKSRNNQDINQVTEPRWTTVREVSAHLKIGRHHCYRLIKAGRIPSYRVGIKILVDLDEVDRLVRSGALARVSVARRRKRSH